MKNYATLILHVSSVCALFAITQPVLQATDLSPSHWPQAEREALEKQEATSWFPAAARAVETHSGLISSTVSPVSVYAGVQALKQGGTAADAAATVALTEITRQLGSVVSYAGIFTVLYYDAKTQKVYSLDAGYNSYLHETDPLTIPAGDLGVLNRGPKPSDAGAKGRETLVPGFMAGIEAMHDRFGRLPFKDLFAPSIYYAENGVSISPILQNFFAMRASALGRTHEGKEFLEQSGRDLPKVGDSFVQPELAATLRAVSEKGAAYMYSGKWANEFVETVQREGGRVTLEDLKRYRPIWSEPYKTTAFGETIYANGAPHYGAFALFSGLHLAEAKRLSQGGACWTDSKTFTDLSRIGLFVGRAPTLDSKTNAFLLAHKIDTSPAAQLTPAFAAATAPFLDQIFTAPSDDDPHHSNSIVVIDREGNIAAVTHTINTLVWGDTGIVVGGIPIPNPASFQQAVLATIKPGERVPHQIIDTICFHHDRPVLATASIGVSLIPESLRTVFSVLAQHQSLRDVMSAPPMLVSIDPTEQTKPLSERTLSLAPGYSSDFIDSLRRDGIKTKTVSLESVGALRGTLSAIQIDEKTGKRSAVEEPSVVVFAQASE